MAYLSVGDLLFEEGNCAFRKFVREVFVRRHYFLSPKGESGTRNYLSPPKDVVETASNLLSQFMM